MNETAKNNQTKLNQHEYEPDIDMRKFVVVLLNEGGGSVNQTERLTKIDRGKFWYHLRRAKDKEDFQRWYVAQVDAFFTSYEAAVSKALLKKVADGDVQAMRLYYELRGRIKAGGVNIQATALPGSRQPLVIVLDKGAADEGSKPAIETTGTVEAKKADEMLPPAP